MCQPNIGGQDQKYQPLFNKLCPMPKKVHRPTLHSASEASESLLHMTYKGGGGTFIYREYFEPSEIFLHDVRASACRSAASQLPVKPRASRTSRLWVERQTHASTNVSCRGPAAWRASGRFHSPAWKASVGERVGLRVFGCLGSETWFFLYSME